MKRKPKQVGGSFCGVCGIEGWLRHCPFCGMPVCDEHWSKH